MEKKKNSFTAWLSLSLCFCVLIVSIFFYLNGDTRSDNHEITLTDVGFDTSVTFQAACTEDEFDSYVQIVKEEFQYYNKLFDQYHAYEDLHNVYTINHEAYDHPVSVDTELVELITFSLGIREQNENFDITQGELLNLWHDAREEGILLNQDGQSGNLPEEASILQAMNSAGKDKVSIIDNEISLMDENTSLDLGGIAKGYAAQKVKEALQDAGLKQGFINAGGNVVLIGEKDPWRIGIQDPDGTNAICTFTTTDDLSIVTSGDYQRCYEVDGVRYSHIIDPQTGYPAAYHRSVSVIGSDSTLADALSTALFCMEIQEGMEFIETQYPDVDVIWIDEEEHADLTPVGKSGSFYIYATSGIQDDITL